MTAEAQLRSFIAKFDRAIALPMKIAGGSGRPLRAIAIVP